MNDKSSVRSQIKKLVRKMLDTDKALISNKKKVQSQVTQLLNKTDYSLNVVNRYKENIVHISAANDCVDVIKCILQKHDKHCLEKKNAFGWTPLMLAIRNENTEMVKFLLNSNVIVNDFSFLGMSVLSLACAISLEMFELIYNSCPSALEYATHDDINPLCVAALKNDKQLFFRLIDLGLDVRKANAFTRTLMKQSTVPEIVLLAKQHLNSDDYWNDLSDIEDLLDSDENIKNNTNSQFIEDYLNIDSCIPRIYVEPSKTELIKKVSNINEKKFFNLESGIEYKSNKLLSPALSYVNEILPTSPNIFITKDSPINLYKKDALNINLSKNFNRIESPLSKLEDCTSVTPLVLRRCQNKRPPNLKLRSSSNDSNLTLSYTPQFSPTKTPNLPNDINEDNVFDETTPTPPKYKTPPRGIILDPNTTKLIYLLQRFGLQRHVPIFLEQEVDLDLFLTLTDQDLIEIGINSKSERLILLSVINECKGRKTCI